jgi:Cu+-exporting ATPase
LTLDTYSNTPVPATSFVFFSSSPSPSPSLSSLSQKARDRTDEMAVSPSSAGAPPHMATTTLKVEGMTCGACTSAVESAFSGVDGAGEVSVSLVMGRAVVHHDPTTLSPSQVATLVEDKGFDAEVLSTDMPQITDDGSGLPTTSVTTIAIEGMTCGACTSAVEGGLTNVPGIQSVNVSLLSERAVVEHDASVVPAAQIAEIIEDRGFGATVLDTQLNQPTDGQDTATQSQNMSTTVAIEGMTCGACTSSVTNAFSSVEGIVQFDISLLAERAVVVHDPQMLPADKIASMIEDVGFDARIVSSTPQTGVVSKSSKPLRLTIYGLQDTVSAIALEELLLQRAGINSASIDFITSRATILHNPAVIGIRSVVEAIEEAGYNALLTESDDNNAQLESLAKTKEIQEWKRAFFTSLSFAVPVTLITMIFPMCIPFLDFGSTRLFPGLYLGDVIALGLTLPIQFGVGNRFYKSSFKSLKHGAPTMDVLVMLGTSAAFFFSVFTMLVAIFGREHERPSTVFDTSTMLITFITLGRWLENRAKGQTSKALSRLMSLAPSMATIYEDPIAAEKSAEEWNEKGDREPASQTANTGLRSVPTELLQVGDIILLRPGDKVSADGVVIRGTSYLDESMITGEAIPINKKKGSAVIAGTVNGAGSLDFKVTRAGSDTQLSQIIKLVQDAQTSRAPIQRMADIVAGYFVPIIIALGLFTFTGWMILSHVLPHPPKIFISPSNGGKVMVCLKLCISVIVFACPCALGLSTPTAVMVGTGVGAEHGILVKGGAALEAATKINHIVLDKTGTLTEGKMSVAEAKLEPTWTSNDWRRKLWWQIVGLAETNSEHPVARAIVMAAKKESGVESEDPLDGSIGTFDVVVGKGISATVEPTSAVERTRYRVLLGNAVFLRGNGVTVPESANIEGTDESIVSSKSDESAGFTQIHVAIDGHYTGTISLRDALKATSVAAVAALKKMGMNISLVTGDTYAAALSVARAVGIPSDAIKAGVSPNEKKEIVESFQADGDRVAMVGDGINDSPALATAVIGIALASGTDVAMEAADIVIMRSDDLLAVPAGLSLARTIFNRIKLNLVWACVYNIIGLPFAMGIFLPFGGIALPPMAAGAAMALSSVSVVGSSLLLKFWQRPKWMNVARLEKEVEMGLVQSRKGLWKENLVYGSAGAVSLVRTVLAKTVFGKRSAQAREEEGYVPLQTVEH